MIFILHIDRSRCITTFQKLSAFSDHSPLEEIRVLRLSDQPRAHHDRLEALSLDRPQIALTDCGNCRRTLAIVEYCQFAENLSARQCREIFALT